MHHKGYLSVIIITNINISTITTALEGHSVGSAIIPGLQSTVAHYTDVNSTPGRLSM